MAFDRGGAGYFPMLIMTIISFALNALVGIFLMCYSGDDLLEHHPDDDRDILWFMFGQGILFFLFGAVGLLLTV